MAKTKLLISCTNAAQLICAFVFAYMQKAGFSHDQAQYFSAQFEHYYHLIPVEPNTPWKYNAHELQHRTTHGVHEEKIQQMLDNLKSQQFLPLYYGWFLTQKDSESLFDLGTRCLKEGVEALGENLPEDINAAGN